MTGKAEGATCGEVGEGGISVEVLDAWLTMTAATTPAPQGELGISPFGACPFEGVVLDYLVGCGGSIGRLDPCYVDPAASHGEGLVAEQGRGVGKTS